MCGNGKAILATGNWCKIIHQVTHLEISPHGKAIRWASQIEKGTTMSRKTPKQPDIDAGYIRVSHVDVPERDPELRKQAIDELVVVRTQELREAAERMGKTIPDKHLYIDMDLSGTSVEKRPGMMQMLAAAQKRSFARIWVKNLSRLFRNMIDQGIWIDKIERAGVKVITLQEPNDGDKATIDLTRNILGSVNQYMAAQTGQVIRANNRIVVSMGRFVGGRPPLGYMYNKETKEVLPDPVRKKDAIMVFEIFCQEKTFIGTAGMLNAMGIKTRNGSIWSHRKVKATLENPMYKGFVHYGGEQWPGLHQKIIPNELLEETDKIIKSRTNKAGNMYGNRRDDNTYTYSRLLTCGLCGRAIRLVPSLRKNDRINYWVCAGKKDNRVCDLPSYRTSEFDIFVVEAVQLALTHELDSIKHFLEGKKLKFSRPKLNCTSQDFT
jgi:DNA invertase Pin-like site-specific DNA recombinase